MDRVRREKKSDERVVAIGEREKGERGDAERGEL